MDSKITTSNLSSPLPSNPKAVEAVYANNVGLTATLTDVQIIFTHLLQGIGASGESSPQNTVQAVVVVPMGIVPHLMRGLTQIFQTHQNAGNQNAATTSDVKH